MPNISTTRGGARHITSRFRKHGVGGARTQRSVMNIRFGYRSLIDWASSPAWTYNMGTSAATGNLNEGQILQNPAQNTAPGAGLYRHPHPTDPNSSVLSTDPNGFLLNTGGQGPSSFASEGVWEPVDYERHQQVRRNNPSAGGSQFNQITTSTSAGFVSTPETWMGTGPKARPGSSHTLGDSASIGAAWNVANPDVPNLAGINNARRAFGHHVPQWLYRLAEIARGTNLSLSEHQNLARFQTSGDPALNAMGEGLIRGVMGPGTDSHIGIRQKRRRRRTDAYVEETGSAAGFEYSPGVYINPQGGVAPTMGGLSQRSWNIGQGAAAPHGGSWHSGQTTAWRILPQLKDSKRNYTSTFSRNVLGGLSQSIPRQMEHLKRAMFNREGANIASSNVVRAMPGVIALNDPGSESLFGTMGATTSGGYGTSAVPDAGGQTHQEKMAELGGLGTAHGADTLHVSGSGRQTPMVSPLGQWGGSNPVDIHFHGAMRSSPRSPEFFRADLTTTSYQKGAHHGIGLTSINSPVTYNANQLLQARRTITAEQEGMRNSWNAIIRVLKSQIYGRAQPLHHLGGVRGSSLSPVEMRRKLAAEQVSASRSGGRAYEEYDAIQAISTMSRSKEEIESILRQELGTFRADHLKHVLHALGVFLQGDAGTWANIMPIDVTYPAPIGPGLATLVMTYDFNDEGYFNEITMRDVHILEGSVETWIYNNRNQSLGIATEQQLRDMANESMAVEGYANISGMGTLMAAIDTGSARVREQAHMAMPIPGVLSGVLDAISTQIIMDLGAGLEQDLTSSVLTEAVRYSRQMRNPSMMSDIPDWINAFASIFLGVPETVADVTAAQGGNDPFWYLWAAPYISTNYPRAGGGEQDTG